LVNRHVTVIATSPPINTALAAKAATQTIPIVFATAADPVEAGLVPSLNRPNGNITGVAAFGGELGPKTLQLLHELIPSADVIGMFRNPYLPRTSPFILNIEDTAKALGLRPIMILVKDEHDVDVGFGTLLQQQIKALYVWPDGFLFSQRHQLVAFAISHKIALASNFREFTTAGGLVSYGTKNPELFRQFGICAGKILRGAKPSDVPVMQTTAFELVLNLKTAKALDLTVPPTLLARADEVIE
jgi:putative ABC transport system substrate-binding protein